MRNKILLGVSASVAIYKSLELIRELSKHNIETQVIMTENATKLISPLLFETISGNPVFYDMFSPRIYSMPHIDLSKSAKTFLIAPATANVISKIACGIADDLLTTTALSFPGKIFIAPAMNSHMYLNPVFQENLKKLARFDKYIIIEPEEGELACGEEGIGRLAALDKIVSTVLKYI